LLGVYRRLTRHPLPPPDNTTSAFPIPFSSQAEIDVEKEVLIMKDECFSSAELPI
jgi:hypothetical protein